MPCQRCLHGGGRRCNKTIMSPLTRSGTNVNECRQTDGAFEEIQSVVTPNKKRRFRTRRCRFPRLPARRLDGSFEPLHERFNLVSSQHRRSREAEVLPPGRVHVIHHHLRGLVPSGRSRTSLLHKGRPWMDEQVRDEDVALLSIDGCGPRTGRTHGNNRMHRILWLQKCQKCRAKVAVNTKKRARRFYVRNHMEQILILVPL